MAWKKRRQELLAALLRKEVKTTPLPDFGVALDREPSAAEQKQPGDEAKADREPSS